MVRKTLGIRFVVVLGVVAAYAVLLPLPDSNQNAHYALVKALADGTPRIDEHRFEIGDLNTWDVSVVEGHVYSNKAPGLALASLPAYAVANAIGVRTTGDPIRMLWVLHLWSVVVPALVLLLLVARLGDRLEPGLGAAAAVSVGLGSLLLPFGTLLFAHLLSTTLAFGAFAVLWRERDGHPRIAWVAFAGALAGLAVVVDYPLAVALGILGVYAVARPGALLRGLAYGAGAVAGVAPLLVYNTWAFGSPTHISYSGSLYGGRELPGYQGLGLPNLGAFVDLLLWGNRSLFVPAPILVAGAAATVILYRRGWRAEALVIAAMAVLFPAYISGHVGPFGDVGPGPRYLIPTLPFLAVPLAIAYRRFPATTVALAAVSVIWMVAVTITHPQAAWAGGVLDRLTSPGLEGYSRTATELVGITGPVRVVPFALAIATAISCAALAARPRRPQPTHVASAGVALGGWVLVLLVVPEVLRSGNGRVADALIGLGLALGVVGGAVLFESRAGRHEIAEEASPHLS